MSLRARYVELQQAIERLIAEQRQVMDGLGGEINAARDEYLRVVVMQLVTREQADIRTREDREAQERRQLAEQNAPLERLSKAKNDLQSAERLHQHLVALRDGWQTDRYFEYFRSAFTRLDRA